MCCAVVAMPARIIGIAVERIIRNQTVGEKGLRIPVDRKPQPDNEQ